jgi:excisionase family DNA binding protein
MVVFQCVETYLHLPTFHKVTRFPHERRQMFGYCAGMNQTQERFLTLTELRERLQVSRSTAWRLVNEHGLRVLRCGGVVRVRESDLQGWIEKHSQDSVATPPSRLDAARSE